MSWLNDLFLFFAVPGLILVAAVLSHRGAAKKYKIVRVTDKLEQSQYEVWFDYTSPTGLYTWRLEKQFETLEQAEQFVSQQHKTRETVCEGSLK